jgi:dienelactone hydrolase
MVKFAPILCLAACAAAQTLDVDPPRVMGDQAAAIRVQGLDAGEHIEIRAELVDGANHHWASDAEFTAVASGSLAVSKQAPARGSYKTISPMGLIWSMRPAEKDAGLYRLQQNFAPQLTRIHLLRKGKEVAASQIEQVFLPAGLRRVPVNEDGIRGVFFIPPGDERKPAILVLPGSEGGIPSRPAAWLALHGYAVLALAYFHFQDLPPRLEAIPLEYFQHALQWMAARPEVAPKRIAVSGGSRGGELALQLGSMFPALRAVVAYVPSNVRRNACCGGNAEPYAWTWKGQPLSFLPVGLPLQSDMAARAAIAVENTRGPILMISGEDDGVWQSSTMADLAMARLKSAHFAFDAQHLKYPHAGHGAGKAYITPEWHEGLRHPVSGREMNLGGTAQGDAESSIDAMPKVLEFLRKALEER